LQSIVGGFYSCTLYKRFDFCLHAVVRTTLKLKTTKMSAVRRLQISTLFTMYVRYC